MRKTKDLVISQDGSRDNGKLFILTEMPAAQAERWAARAFNSLARSNIEIPDSVAGAGIVGIFVIGMKMLFAMEWAVTAELMDEMLGCVVHVPDIANNPGYTRPLVGSLAVADDVEEVETLILLRQEVFALHAGFTLAEAISKLTSALNPAASSSTETSPA